MKPLLLFLTLSLSLLASEAKTYTAEIVPAKMSVHEKKARFIALVEPAVQKVHAKFMKQFIEVQEDLKQKKNPQRITQLKAVYKVKSDEDLLLALKPHPQSIAIAQAAMESAWATSRFFVEAKNIFGMWSSNPKEPRIAAGEKRGGTKTIWLRKFATVEESVDEYYKLMGRGRAFKEFREVRYVTNDPFKIIVKLDKYSEIGDKYAEELGSMIRYNKFQRFDN